MPAVWTQVLFCSDQWLSLDTTAGSIHPKFLVLTMWAKNLLGHGAGACVPPPAAGEQPGLLSGCRLPRRWAPQRGGMLSPAPIALLQLTRNFQANIPAEAYGRKYAVCYVYTSNSDKVFCVIGSVLLPELPGCDLNRHLNLYSQGHPHLLLFIRKMLCCYYFFSFCRCKNCLFCQAQQLFSAAWLRYQKW